MTISQPIKSQNNLTLPQIHCEDGQKKEKLDVLDQMQMQKKVENESTTSTILEKSLVSKKNKLKTDKQSATQELVPTTKKKTSKDKSIILKKLTKKQILSKTLDLDLTGTGLDLNPFWKEYTKEVSRKLWLPTEIDYVDLDSNLLNGSSKNLMSNSWFSAQILENKTCQENSQKTCSRLLRSLSQKIMGLDQLNTSENVTKKIAKIIRIYPTKTQIKTFREWSGLQRWVYNQCVNRHKENQKNKKTTTLKDLRENIINTKNFEKENTWVKEYDYDLRDEAVRDFMKNLKSNLAKGGKFELEFRSLKQQNTTGFSLSVLKKKWNKKRGFYSKVFKPSELESHQKLPDSLPSDSRLIKNSLNQYFIAIPIDIKSCDNQTKRDSMIFLDPGVKNFVVGYDPNGKVVIWGERDVARIARLLHHKRKLQSFVKKEKKNKRRKRLRMALLRIGNKINNLVTDLHKKLSKFLCLNYKKIFLPRLNFHNFKKLNKKSKALMSSYRHCEFLDKLKDKAISYGSKVFEVNEAYTSKTCSNCGYIKMDLSNSNIYNCNSCNISIGRDINAAKNIMLRLFTKLS